MGKRGSGYGSEDHFLRYRSDRAEEFDRLLPNDPYQVPLFPQHVPRCSDTVHRSSVSTWVDGVNAR